nr:hypothetical protein [Gemmatimonadota bacterium]NIQ56127.1 hypothetical protein [Gemmatimonadota bacterium]NIX45813.1 hypothetical protein [Gemmatimonadota bacterium]
MGGSFSHASSLRDGGGALVIVCPEGSCGSNVAGLWLADLERDTVALLSPDVVGAWQAEGDRVVYVDNRGAVFTALLDRAALRLGTPTPLFDGVQANQIAAEMQMDTDGTLLYRVGEASSGENEQIYWVDRDGRSEPVQDDWWGDFASLALSPDETLLAFTDESS